MSAWGSDKHFNTIKEAQAYADNKGKEEFGLLGEKTNSYSKHNFQKKVSELAEKAISHYPTINGFKPRAEFVHGNLYIKIPVDSIVDPTEDDWNFYKEHDGSLQRFEMPYLRSGAIEVAKENDIDVENIEKNIELMEFPKNKSIKYDTMLKNNKATLDIYITLEYDEYMERTDKNIKKIISELSKRL